MQAENSGDQPAAAVSHDVLINALENVRVLAGRHRKEPWAQHLLRFCADAGVVSSPFRTAAEAPSDVEKALPDLILAIAASALEDGRKAYEQAQDAPAMKLAVKAVESLDPQRFHFALIHPMEKLAAAVLERHLPGNHAAQFYFSGYDFVQAHLKRLFARFEGGACSTDKARWCISRLIRHAITGQEIVFLDAEHPDAWAQPQRILNTQESLVAFGDALRKLHWGMPDAYVRELGRLVEQAPGEQEAPQA